jgi:transcription elongation factor/antiterminator RfaH
MIPKPALEAALAECVRNGKDAFELAGRERWYVAQTLHHREKLAELHLNTRGFRSFFPRFRKTVRHARKSRDVAAPLFPGYIFVILDAERDRWRSINQTLGVARLLTALEHPVPVPADIVEALIGTLDHSGLVLLGADLKPGQAVRIVVGPFAGELGVLERLDAKGRVRVLLNIMGSQAGLRVDRAYLAA